MKKFWELLKAAVFGSKEVKADDTSEAKSLDKVDVVKILRNMAMVSLAAAVTYLTENDEILAKFGPSTVAVVYAVLDIAKRFFKDNMVAMDESEGE